MGSLREITREHFGRRCTVEPGKRLLEALSLRAAFSVKGRSLLQSLSVRLFWIVTACRQGRRQRVPRFRSAGFIQYPALRTDRSRITNLSI